MTPSLTKLPVYATSFIGRDRAEHAVLDLLRDESVRMLTLVGASGSGKTRLSVQVAAQAAAAFPDGCVFVSLAPVTDPDLVLITLAHTLELAEQGAESVLDTLAAALRSRRMLIVLDNLEQVRAAAPQLQALLERTDGLRLLITSQVPLEVPAEMVYAVPPLALPQDAALDLETLPTYSAIALFVDRMRQVQPTFAITPQNSLAIIEICQLVEGLPLAIELIAAHSAVLAPEDLLLFLHQHLSVGRLQRSLDSRARIIRPILDWCVSRLEPAVQQVFLRLGMFVGGWTQESAAAVCNAADDLPVDLVEALETLHAKHLILEEMLWGQEQRYLMLDTVHEYTRQRLRTLRQLPALERTHAAYFAALAADAYQARAGAQQGAWLERLEQEYHNIRAALRWTERQPPPALGELSRHLGFFWRTRGYLYEGREWLRTVLADAPRLTPGLAADLAYALSLILLDLADYGDAQSTLDRGLAFAQAAADPLAEANILQGLGRLAYSQGRLLESLEYLRRNLAVFRSLGDQGGEARMLSNIALVSTELGQFQDALDSYAQSLEIARSIGNTFSESITLTNMGQMYWTLGRFTEGIDVSTRALALAETLGDQQGIALNQINLGELRSRQGEYQQAIDHLRHGIRIARETGLTSELAQGLGTLAGVVLRTGDVEQARRLAVEALNVVREHDLRLYQPDAIEQIARIAIAEECWADAARLLGFAAAQRHEQGIRLGPTQERDHRELNAAVQARLDPAERERLAAEGASTTIQELTR